MRIGFSKDLHLLDYGRKLMLGGVEIDYPKGTVGYSDGDALLHAISEALLGSLALGDLGTNFPVGDERYHNISSMIILEESYKKIKNLGYKIINVDSMIYCEEPKLSGYIIKMREKIAKTLEINLDQISIKATTYEKTGEIGKSLALAAEAVCLIDNI